MRNGNDRTVARGAGTAAVVIAAAGGILAGGQALAQGDRTLEVDVAECVEIESPAERFRCYEGRVDAALGETARSAPTPEPAPAPEEARAAESSPPAPAPADNETTAPPFAPSGGVSSTGAPSSSVIPEREIAAERSADVDDFGLSRPVEREAREERRAQEEFFGTIASIRETVPNRYIVTLENGQVWRQVRPTFYPLRAGHRVRIYSTHWGDSYRMSSEELRGFIQVERVR